MPRTASPFTAVLLAVLPALTLAQTPAPSPAPAASPAADAAAPTFPSEVDLVTVDVVVTDKKGTPITGLTAADFQLIEEGGRQTVASFEAITLPDKASDVAPPRPRVSTNQTPEVRGGRSFVILFDDIHLSPPQAHRAKTAVAQFLRTGVREGDRVSLVSTSGSAWWSTRMEAGRDELIEMTKRLDGRLIPDTSPDRMSDYEAMRIHVYRDAQTEERVARRFETYGASMRQRSDSELGRYTDGDPLVRARASEIYFQSVARNRITLEVLERILQSLSGTRGRKSIILVSQGFIYDPNLDEFKRTLAASRRSNAAIYFVDTRGLGGFPSFMSAEFGPAIDTQDIGAAFLDTMQEAEGAESLAADSGGFTVKNTNDFSKGIGRIANETRSYYLIGYHPTNTARDGRFRKIEVKVPGRKGLQVRARRGYFAPLDGPSRVEAKPGVDPELQAAVDSPYDRREIPLKMTSWVFDETLLGKATTVVGADVDVSEFDFREQDGRFVDTLEFLMVVAHRETGEFFRYDQKIEMKLLPATRERMRVAGYPIVRDFELAPGGYQAKIVVRDQNSGRIGTLVHEFEVPKLQGLRVSTPVISDTLQQPEEPGKGAPRVPVEVDRTLAPGSTFYASFEVYGAERDRATTMPNVAAGYVLRSKDGRVVAEVPPTRIQPTSLGRLSRIVGSPLGDAAPGEYEFVLTLKDEVSGRTVEVTEPFQVAASAPAVAAGAP